MKYFCHDPLSSAKASESKAGSSRQDVLDSVKKYLATGIPSMFGFWGFASFDSSDVKGGIPYPGEGEKAEWGHAIVAVGYDDGKKIKNTLIVSLPDMTYANWFIMKGKAGLAMTLHLR